jgi:hypothetical protein
MTMVVTMAQAEACAQADVAYISPPIGAVSVYLVPRVCVLLIASY